MSENWQVSEESYKEKQLFSEKELILDLEGPESFHDVIFIEPWRTEGICQYTVHFSWQGRGGQGYSETWYWIFLDG